MLRSLLAPNQFRTAEMRSLWSSSWDPISYLDSGLSIIFRVTFTLLEPMTRTAATRLRGCSDANACRIVLRFIQLRMKSSFCASPYCDNPTLTTNNPELRSNRFCVTKISTGSDSSSSASRLRMKRQPSRLFRNKLCSITADTETAGSI